MSGPARLGSPVQRVADYFRKLVPALDNGNAERRAWCENAWRRITQPSHFGTRRARAEQTCDGHHEMSDLAASVKPFTVL
jgi:hypothetical protein